MLERRGRGRGELNGVETQPGTDFRVDHRGQCGMDPGCGGPADRGDVGAGGGAFRVPGEAFRVAGAKTVQRRQERPLVLLRLERAEVEERGESLLPAPAVQWRGDEVAEATVGKDVRLGNSRS